jgi:homoserine dehydrogenase
VSALRTGLAGNDVRAIYGIVNGTCNYILSQMRQNGLPFDRALREAQEKGYAEADPTLDINGGDSAHKLTIMGSLAFGCELALSDVLAVGIDDIAKEDIQYGAEMGYSLKLLAIAEKDAKDYVSLRVHPAFIDSDSALARVNGSFNAVSVLGDAVGHLLFYGRGAGMMPTASAVVADLLEVALGNSLRTFQQLQLQPREAMASKIVPVDQLVSRFYIRLLAQDRPGVIATLGRVLGDHDISISGVLQHERIGASTSVPLVIVTHETQDHSMTEALQSLADLDVICGKPVCIRIVDVPNDEETS